MSNSIWKQLVGATGRLLLAYLLVLSQSVWAGQDPKAKENPKPEQKAAAQSTGEKPSSAATATKAQTEEVQGEESEQAATEQKSSGDGKHEGIKVHGHWTIEVRNPDGTLATHREFENSLVQGSNGGDYLLVQLLGRASVLTQPQQGFTGFWEVLLSGGTSGLCGTVPVVSGGSIGICVIGESSDTSGIPTPNKTLTLAIAPVGASPSLTLSGNVTSPSSGTVGIVTTFIASQLNLSGQGIGGSITKFSEAPVNPSVVVLAGQSISVTVVFTFS